MKPITELSHAALDAKRQALLAIVRLDGGDIQARRDLLTVNNEIGRRRREREQASRPIIPQWMRPEVSVWG